MFRDMRRKRQVLDEQECLDVLERGAWCVLGLHGDDGYPYTVPLNYVFRNGKIYFHSAKTGHKIDAIARDDKASLCVVDRDTLVPEKFTTYFRSVIAFGRIRVVEDPDEQEKALVALVEALSGGEDEASKRAEVDSCTMRSRAAVLEFTPEHISGKQAKELVPRA